MLKKYNLDDVKKFKDSKNFCLLDFFQTCQKRSTQDMEDLLNLLDEFLYGGGYDIVNGYPSTDLPQLLFKTEVENFFFTLILNTTLANKFMSTSKLFNAFKSKVIREYLILANINMKKVNFYIQLIQFYRLVRQRYVELYR